MDKDLNYRRILSFGWTDYEDYKEYKIFLRLNLSGYIDIAFWDPKKTYWRNYVTFLPYEYIKKKLYIITEIEREMSENWNRNNWRLKN
jgi:hypothetical protein